MALNVSLFIERTGAPDRQKTFTVSFALRRVSGWPGRTTKRLSENKPDIPAVCLKNPIWQSGGYVRVFRSVFIPRSGSSDNLPRREFLQPGQRGNPPIAAWVRYGFQAGQCISAESLAIQLFAFLGEVKARSMAFQTCSSKASVSGEFSPGRVA